VGKLEGKRPLRRPKRIWVDSIKIDLGDFDKALQFSHFVDADFSDVITVTRNKTASSFIFNESFSAIF
jgi:hypothetical protein